MTDKRAICELCGEPMPDGEEAFKLHGYSGPCPKPPKKMEWPPKPEQLSFMTREEKALLLTVARLLRCALREDINASVYANRPDDLAALDEALAPFGPAEEPAVNEADEGQTA